MLSAYDPKKKTAKSLQKNLSLRDCVHTHTYALRWIYKLNFFLYPRTNRLPKTALRNAMTSKFRFSGVSMDATGNAFGEKHYCAGVSNHSTNNWSGRARHAFATQNSDSRRHTSKWRIKLQEVVRCSLHTLSNNSPSQPPIAQCIYSTPWSKKADKRPTEMVAP